MPSTNDPHKATCNPCVLKDGDITLITKLIASAMSTTAVAVDVFKSPFAIGSSGFFGIRHEAIHFDFKRGSVKFQARVGQMQKLTFILSISTSVIWFKPVMYRFIRRLGTAA